MVVMVEQRFGRSVLIETMLDPRRFLVLYNQAAAEQNAPGRGPCRCGPPKCLGKYT